MGLPCRHIFKLRQLENIPLFSRDLCNVRWTRDYLYNNHRAFEDGGGNTPEATLVVASQPKPRPASKGQKLRRCNEVTSRICDVLSDCTSARFDRRLDQLEFILAQWSSDRDFHIEPGKFHSISSE